MTEGYFKEFSQTRDIRAADAIEKILNNLLAPEPKPKDIRYHNDQEKERNAATTGEDKVFQQANRKKQMRFEREHNLTTKIVTLFCFPSRKFEQ